MNEKEISLKISSKLEYLIKIRNIKAIEIARTIPMTNENFSFFRNKLKKGKFPSSKFLIGISIYFDENFLN